MNLRSREGVDDPTMSLDSLPAESSLADQKEDDAADERERQEQDDPSEPSRRFDPPTAEDQDDQTDSECEFRDDQGLADEIRRAQEVENVFENASSPVW